MKKQTRTSSCLYISSTNRSSKSKWVDSLGYGWEMNWSNPPPTKCPAKSNLGSLEIRKTVTSCWSRPAIHYYPPQVGRQCHQNSDQQGLHGTTLLLEKLNSEHKSVSGFRQKGWSWLSGVAYSIYTLLNIYRAAVSCFGNSNIPQPFPSPSSEESFRAPSTVDLSSGSTTVCFLGSQQQIPKACLVLAPLQPHV